MAITSVSHSIFTHKMPQIPLKSQIHDFYSFSTEITQGDYVEDSVEYMEEGNLLKVSVLVSKKKQLLLKGTEDSGEDLDEGNLSKESKLLLEGAEGSVELFDKDNLSKVVRVAKEKQVFNDVVIMVDNGENSVRKAHNTFIPQKIDNFFVFLLPPHFKEKKDFILVFFNDELVLECEIKPLDLDYSKKNEKQVVTKGRRKPAPKPGTFDDSGLGLKYISFASPENGKLATFFYGCVSE